MRSSFTYRRAGSAAEAVALLAEHGMAAQIWAGGTDMTLDWKREKVAPDLCIDIRRIEELDYIAVDPDAVRIGAMASLARLERAGGEHDLLGMLSDVAKLMCTPQTRTLATVGGNLCNASPAADLSPALVALDARVRIMGVRATREVALVDFFKGVNRTDLEPAELLQEIVIPLPDAGTKQGAYRRVDRTVVDIALVAGAAALTASEGIITRAGFGLGAVSPVIPDAPEASAMIEGKALAEVTRDLLAAVAAKAAENASPISDVRASASYRQEMLGVMLRRSLEATIAKHGRTLS